MRRTQPMPDAVSLILVVSLSFAPPAAASALGPASEALASCAAELAATASAAPAEDTLVASSAETTVAPAADADTAFAPATTAEDATPVPADPETIRVRIGRVPAFEATMLSLAATAGPTIWLLNDREAQYGDGAPLAAFAGLMAGPAVGYFYGGQPLRGLAGVGFRSLCLGAAVAGNAVSVAAVFGILASDAYDILMLGPNLNHAAEQRAIRVTTRKLHTSRATGVGLSATF